MDFRDWFTKLFGFIEDEDSGARLRHVLSITWGDDLKFIDSTCNYSRYCVGKFEHVSLEELDSRSLVECNVQSTMEIISGDVVKLFIDPDNNGATFQVASQFNCLEFINPDVVPEDGVTCYVRDRTQGPICSIACGPATVYRNYFIPMTKSDGSVQSGQSADLQLDGMSEISSILGNTQEQYYRCRNGYLTANVDQLTSLNIRLGLYVRENTLDTELSKEDVLQQLGKKLKIGVHYNVEVTSQKGGCVLTKSPEQRVTQVFGSAIAIGYSQCQKNALWADLTQLVLNASYESVFRVAAMSQNKKLFLTFIGGGVFTNPMHWIEEAIRRGAEKYRGHGLQIVLVCYGGPSPSQTKLVEEFNKGAR